MKILLTGASGFVGSSILKYLRADKKIELVTVSRIRPVSQSPGPRLRHTISDLENDGIQALFAYEKYDLLIHAAWQGLPVKSAELNARNAHTSSILFQEFVKSGGKSVVAIGSCLEYGNRTGHVPESDLGVNLGEFGVTKRKLSLQVAKLGIPFLWLRPFYLYGANQHPNSLLNLTLANLFDDSFAWLKEPCVANDFVYVDDLGRLLYTLVKKKLWLGELNIGTSALTANIEFVNSVRRFHGRKEYEMSGNEAQGMTADLTKLQEVLPNFSFTSLAEGLKSSIENMKRI